MTDATAANAELVIERSFNASREVVWAAWTQPEALDQWWGPHIFENRVISFDLQPGGLFRYTMKRPDGEEMYGRFRFIAIEPPQRLEFASSFTDADGNPVRAPWDATFPLELHSELTFQQEGAQTRLMLRCRPLDTAAAGQAAFCGLLPSMQQGWGGTLDALEQYLAQVG